MPTNNLHYKKQFVVEGCPVQIPAEFKGFQNIDMHARAWPARENAIGSRATDKFDTLARAARVASLGRKTENALVFQWILRDQSLKIFC